MQQYNTQLPKIALPEYGRNVQKLIQYCKTIPDRTKRTKYAYTIVDIMADIYPEVGQVENGKRILWDHLALISNFELDIDYPYPILPKEELQSAPSPLKKAQTDIQYRMYGKVIEGMVEKARTLTDPAERIRLFELCANHMKRNFHLVNKDADEDNEKIISDLIGYAGPEFKDEIMQVYLYSTAELQKNDQFDPASLVVSTKKKKKKKKK
ncbi:MAG: DUF4290 domain-containing protein [Bacteroidales bacterium]|nr:DUF4290 domain-containing protein [Bacteroidales bacterium]